MDRTVIEYSFEYDPSRSSSSTSHSPRTQPLCLAVTTTSDSQIHLLFGTRAGTVNLLRIPPPIPTGKDSQITHLDLVRFVSVSDSPVEDVLLLPEIDRLLVLSGGCLFLIGQGLSGAVQRVSGVKGVTSVSKRLRFGDTASGDPLGDVAAWCEAARPKTGILQRLGRANGMRVRGVDVQRNGGSGGGSSCFVAAAMFVKGVVLMELTVGADGTVSLASREIPGVGGVKSMIWFDDSIIFGTTEGYVLFSVGTGEITPIFSLPESSGPPKMKALSRSKVVLLMVDNVGIVVNGNGQPVGGSLVFSCMPESITVMSQYVVSLEDGRLKLYRKKTGACVQAIPFSKVGSGPCVMACDEHGNGEVIAITTPYKIVCFRKIYVEEQIKDLLRKKYYKDAVCLVEELKFENEMTDEMSSFVHAQVGFLLLFDLHFEDAINHFLLSESMQPSEIFPFVMQDPNRWSHLVPRKRYWGLHPPPMLLEKVVDDGLLAIQRTIFLKRAGVPTTMDEDYILNPPSKVILLESAIKNMIRYFLVCRDRDLTSSIKEGVDTLLMYLYRALNLVDEMEQLATSANSCVVEELENLLDDSGHLRTLAFLYASKGRNSKALDIWKLLARNYSSGLWKDPTATVQNSLDNSTDIISCQRSAAVEASKLLEESSDQELVLQHLRWIGDQDQDLAVKVLTSSKRANQLSHGEVLAMIDPGKVEIHQRYLQWLIDYEHLDDTQFHTMYAISLAKSAIQAIEMDMDVEDNIDREYNPVLENGEASVNSVRQRMQSFLQSSDLYDPQEVLYLIKDSELWLEKAILYKKLGQETRVLQILGLKLEDGEAAQQYCAEIGRHDAYMQLLDMYLDPQNGKEPMFNAAVQLLHNHGESLNPLRVLEKLSPDMPLQHVSDTILRILRARVHHYRQGQVLYNLSSALNLEAQMAIQEERSRHVQINDESICSSCHTRLGTKLLAMYPDDTVVCYKCYRRQGESASESGRNFKHDILFKPGWLVTRP